MTVTVSVEILKQAFLVGLMLALPLLLTTLVIGLVIGILQAATGVQEFTLTFVPKVLAIFAIILLLGASGLTLATEFTVRMLNIIPQVVR
ncbi:MAG: flagellar biosynthetic protein FliQ [Armatimonadetes bacterium]|nr:flagellar biosynthetic protein FliQ [Armatimonadota bacterium]MDW8027461.1 flagellar biosynthetic protein FliQ [Armatimonadota bacterium]